MYVYATVFAGVLNEVLGYAYFREIAKLQSLYEFNV